MTMGEIIANCKIKPMSAAFIGFLLLGSLFNLTAQSNPALGRFSATESNGSVYLGWTMLAGFTCSGIQVFRSTDSIQFNRIGLIPEICGSVSEALSYTFEDPAPILNQVNYYRLELGPYGLSPTVSIEVIAHGDLLYQIRPHPIVGEGQIYFVKTSNETHELILYTPDGIVAYRLTTQGEYFALQTESLPSGVYPFTIGPAGKAPSIMGKMAIIH